MEPSSWQRREKSVATTPGHVCSPSCRPCTYEMTQHYEANCPSILGVHVTADLKSGPLSAQPHSRPTQRLSAGEAGALLAFRSCSLFAVVSPKMALLCEENKPWKPRGKRSFHAGEIKFRGDIKPEPPNRRDRSGSRHLKRWRHGFQYLIPRLDVGI